MHERGQRRARPTRCLRRPGGGRLLHQRPVRWQRGLQDLSGRHRVWPADLPDRGPYPGRPRAMPRASARPRHRSPASPMSATGTSATESCTSSSIQCTAGNVCTNASCGLKPNGAICSAGKECKSGFCAQGMCCNSACTDACMACNLSATPGLCTVVADNAPDPQGKCVATPSNTCGTTGNCVKGTCGNWTTTCAPASCASTSSVRSVSTCNGAGACVAGPVVGCTNQACVSGACQGVCGPGQLRCFDNGVQTCTATGTWGAAVPCLSQACLNGACTGSLHTR